MLELSKESWKNYAKIIAKHSNSYKSSIPIVHLQDLTTLLVFTPTKKSTHIFDLV